MREMRNMKMMLAFPKALDRLRCTLAVVVALAFAVPVLAQTLYGSLVGTVTDESGLAVPGATVKITHLETNQSREAVEGEGAEQSPRRSVMLTARRP